MSKLIPSFAVLVLALGVSACGSDEPSSPAAGSPSGTATTNPTESETGPTAESRLTVLDPWVKTADAGMSAVFGTLRNTTDTDLTVVSATTSAAGMVELHETVAGADGSSRMQQRDGGFTVPAAGTLELAPGGNHLMLMELSGPIKAGATVALTLTLSDGSTSTFEAIGKDFAGAQESYAPEAEHSMSGMSH